MDAAKVVEIVRAMTPHRAPFAIAFSAGFDSAALARLALDADRHPTLLHVDHQTDHSSLARQRAVELADELGLELRVLEARFDDLGGGFEASARRARYQALSVYRDGPIWLAQTRDDYIETVWLRLLSGSSPLFWKTMPKTRAQFERPVLGIRRAELRQWSSGAYAYPMNDDPAFDRVWLRRSGALERLDPDGRLADALANLGERVRILSAKDWDMPLHDLPPAIRQLCVRTQIAALLPAARVRTRFVREVSEAAGRPSSKTRCFSVAKGSLYLRGGQLVLNSSVDDVRFRR